MTTMPDRLTLVAEVLVAHGAWRTGGQRIDGISEAVCICGILLSGAGERLTVPEFNHRIAVHQARSLAVAGLLPETTAQTKADALREFAQWAQESDPAEHPFLGLDEVVQAARAYAEQIEEASQ
jgi:hypothetical protein